MPFISLSALPIHAFLKATDSDATTTMTEVGNQMFVIKIKYSIKGSKLQAKGMRTASKQQSKASYAYKVEEGASPTQSWPIPWQL